VKFRQCAKWIVAIVFLTVFFSSVIGFSGGSPEVKGSTASAFAVNASQTGKAPSDPSGCNLTVSGDTSNGSLNSVNVAGTGFVSGQNVTLKLFEGVEWSDGRFTSGWKERLWYYNNPNSSYMSTNGDTLSMTIIGADTATSAYRQFSTPIDPNLYKYVIVRVRGTSNAQYEIILKDGDASYETTWYPAPSSYGVYAFPINATQVPVLTGIMLCVHSWPDKYKQATVSYDFVMLSSSPSTARYPGDGESARVFASGPSFSKSIPWVHTNTTYTISAYDEAGYELGSINYVVRRLQTHCIDMDRRNVAGATVKYFTSSFQTDADGWTDGLILQQTNLKINATWQGALVNETFNYNLTGLYNVLTVKCKIYNLKIIVKDLYGNPIEGSLISATLPSGTTIQATSNASGMAVFQTLPGSYKVTISYFGQTNTVEGDIPQASKVSIVFFGSLMGLALTVLWISCLASIVIVWRTGTLPLLASEIKSFFRNLLTAVSRLFKAGYLYVRYPSRSAHMLVVNNPIIPLLLMFVPLVSLIGFNVPTESFALAAFLLGLAGAFLSVFHWKILTYFKEEWKTGTPKFLLQQNDSAAEVIAVYAFYFLVIGVAFSFLDLLKGKTHLEGA
jgi:hypothetical protein